MVYLVVASGRGTVHGRTREQNYIEDYLSIKPEEQEIVQTTEQRSPEVYQQERTPNFNSYRLHNIITRRNYCIKSYIVLDSGSAKPICKSGCELTCVPSTGLE